MHDLHRLLAELRADGVQMWVEEGRLRVRAPAGLSERRRTQLRERREALVAHLERGGDAPGNAPRPATLPLSCAQEGLWFLDRAHRSGAAYNLPVIVRLRGALDTPALLRAFADLEERHEVLRTRYPAVNGSGTQDILAPGSLDIDVVDLAARPANEMADVENPAVGKPDVEKLLQAEAEHAFDIERSCPLRCRLVRLGEDEHVLAVTMHHIVADAPSVAVMFADLAELYAARREGRSARLPKLAAQYADFALRQRRWVENGDLDAQLDYWTQRLSDAPESLDLPTDRPRPALPSFRGSLAEFRWSPALTARVVDAAGRRGMTPFMWLMAAFQLLLARWSGQTDICVGAPIAAQAHDDPHTEGLIGYFLNTIVLRANVAPSLSVDAFLAQARQDIVAAYENSQVPFDVVVAGVRAARPEGVNPLFQVLFAFDEVDANALVLPGLETQRMLTELRSAKFDLSLFMSLDGEQLRGGFEFATDLFDRATLERLAGHFEVLVESLLDSGNARIGDLPLLTGDQRRQMLETWNHTELALPAERTLHGLFGQSARLHHDRIALVHGARSMSYAELDRASNHVAHRLIAMGAGPEHLVGICMNRCPEMVIGLLGILKAGAAYLPLDPVYPPARLAFMLTDSGARRVLSLDPLVTALPVHDCEVLCLDTAEELIAAEPTHCPGNRALPQNLAYVIYTSGSTGKPKAVALQHCNATAFVAWADSAFARDTTRVTLAGTSICFDLSVFELFIPLLTGGTVILVESATALIEQPLPIAPTLVNTVPSSVKALLDAGALPEGMTTINLAGEPLPRTLVESIYAAAPGARVFNLYGPSEYTTYSTWCHVASDPTGRVGIGRPVANTRIYILDRRGEPVPIGTPGEIFIAGTGLARGYAHRPALTAERFVPDPFGLQGGRMYATGDLGRYRADGSIDYLGRLDQQVKIRGFRIEPGEIEARLRRCEGVAEAAVVPRRDRFGEQQLVAHLVTSEDMQCRPMDELRAKLAQDLPAYMVPAVFDVRETLPLTPNGKIDRKALAQARLAGTIERARYVAPRDATESLLAEIWTDVLRLERVGIDDNFFALGGHSLLASRIVARLRQSPLTHFGLRELFLAPTVRLLAACTADAPTAVPDVLVPIDRSGPIATSFSQQRMWFIDQLDPQSGLYNVCIAWGLTGQLTIAALHDSLTEIWRRHEALRTVFIGSDDGPPLQIVTEPTPLPLPLFDLSLDEDPEAAARSWLQHDAARPFDLARGPLFRAALVKLAAQEHVLQLGMPHIVADGWSLDVILSELGALYPAFLKGQPSPLLPLPIQYGDYAHWERGMMRGEVLEGHMRYCRELLAGAPKQLRLPWDRPRPAVASYRGEIVEFVLDAALSEALRDLARRFQVTLFMLMAAVFDVLLFRYSRQDDFCIGYSVGNRNRVETEGLIGAFVNVLVHRARMSADQSFAAHLAQVREGMLNADAHQELPFEKMVEELSPVRDLAHHPIFQVTYSYSTTHSPRTRRTRTLRGVGEREVSLPGLDLRLVEPGYLSAKFDLSLFVSDTGDVLEGDLEFSTDLFDRETIGRIAGQLDTLCRAVVADPHRPVNALSLLPAAERRQLVEWNRTALPLDAAASLHERFERQAARRPEAIALEAGGERLPYAELNARANRLACRLRRLGVGPETRVAVCVGRRAELVVSLLAVLKAGGAYVPLDPAYPPATLAHMLSNSGALAVLAGAREAHLLPAHDGVRVLVEPDADAWADESTADPPPLARPQNIAYCLYTSGSTGLPKAVEIQHGSALALLAWAETAYAVSETARMLAVTSVCFDLSVFEIFLPLVRGGCVVLLEDVAAAATVAAPSLINAVPSSINGLLAVRSLPKSVRTINLAGEVLDQSLVEKIEAAAAGVRIVNLYGPTEYTTYATFDEVGDGRKVTIGRPVGNTSIYILDDHLEPTPIGVPGEIHIAGAGLARGYLGHPSLTAARFVPNPFGPPGTRMYATGDTARYLPDGRVDFRGRSDHQVKFHGFRIELGEIEQALRRCMGVTDAVVTVTDDGVGEKRLAGFVTVEEGAAVSTTSLQSELARILPRHMVPNLLTLLETMPRTPNGKVDRNALREVDLRDAAAPTIDPTPPSTASEILLAGIWKELLGVDALGTQQSFFVMGGNSMAAIRLVARIAVATGLMLALRAVFEHPTIAALAAHIDSGPMSPRGESQPQQPIPSFDRRWAARPLVVASGSD